MPNKMLKYVGELIRTNREKCGLSQQELAEQAGRGLRHLQNIEAGGCNPSYEVLASIIKRLGISPNILFYPDATEVEQAAQHLLGKLMACTEDERQIILTTLDCMAEELIKRHQKLPNSDLN